MYFPGYKVQQGNTATRNYVRTVQVVLLITILSSIHCVPYSFFKNPYCTFF